MSLFEFFCKKIYVEPTPNRAFSIRYGAGIPKIRYMLNLSYSYQTATTRQHLQYTGIRNFKDPFARSSLSNEDRPACESAFRWVHRCIYCTVPVPVVCYLLENRRWFIDLITFSVVGPTKRHVLSIVAVLICCYWNMYS
jgi:hypothetical protein